MLKHRLDLISLENQLVCGSCFLRREGFFNEVGNANDVDDIFSMPLAFGGKVAEEQFSYLRYIVTTVYVAG